MSFKSEALTPARFVVSTGNLAAASACAVTAVPAEIDSSAYVWAESTPAEEPVVVADVEATVELEEADVVLVLEDFDFLGRGEARVRVMRNIRAVYLNCILSYGWVWVE